MSTPRIVAPPAQILKWVAVGALGGLILGLLASLLIRPQVDTDLRLVVPSSESGQISALVIGGSLADGFYASTEGAAFSTIVAAGLGPDVTVGRGSVTHSTIAQATEEAVIPPSTGLVVIEIGSTDVYQDEISPAEFATQYRALVDKVRERSPGAVIVCLGIWGRTAVAEPFDEFISRPCIDAGGVFVPLADIYDDPSMKGPANTETFLGTSDNFHPNDSGHAAIAQRILDNLRVE